MEETRPIPLFEADHLRAQQLHLRRAYRMRPAQLVTGGILVVWLLFVWMTWDDPPAPGIAFFMHVSAFVAITLPLSIHFVTAPFATPGPRTECGSPARADNGRSHGRMSGLSPRTTG